MRTGFLLQYLSDHDLRRTILRAMNKSESLNGLLKWLFFGGEGLIMENRRDEQRKIIKYNHLVANLVIFHNVVMMRKVLRQLLAEGHAISAEVLAVLSPYLTAHINRLGLYSLQFGVSALLMLVANSGNAGVTGERFDIGGIFALEDGKGGGLCHCIPNH